ncbi:MAG: M23 family metallopeptidase [Candidatus Paceibacterota bacterium]
MADINIWLIIAIFPIQDEIIINLRLILHLLYNLISGVLDIVIQKPKIKAIKSVFGVILTAELVLLLLSFIAPPSAHAGFFSAFSNIFGSNSEEFSARGHNSQTMPLLQAPLSLNPSVGGGEVSIVDDSAIMPELNAIGSIGEDVLPGQISLYVVRKGDTLGQIARMFGVTTNTIVWANDLPGGTISVGQTLVILPISGVKHIVKSGDTVESIAKKYKSDVDEIRQFNDIPSDGKLAVGDEVIVPDGEMAPVQTKVNPYSKTVPPSSYGAPKNPLPMRSVPDGYYSSPLASYRKTQGIHGYNGVDLAAPLGSTLMAAADGVVIVSKNTGWNGGYGTYVVIAHDNGTQTLYAHMSRTIVYVGQRVKKGQMIGNLGSTGKSTGPHVHFEIRGAVNPF